MFIQGAASESSFQAKGSISNFFESLFSPTQKISSVDSTSLLQSLGRFLPVKYQKGVGPTVGCPYHIGDFAQGGVIIWLTHDGLHGLVAAIEDLKFGGDSKIQWATNVDFVDVRNYQPLPFSTPQKPYNQYYGGYKNQQEIETKNNWESKYPVFKATVDYSYTSYGVEYTDWFLPSQSELSLMFGAREVINLVSVANKGSAMVQTGAAEGDLDNSFYWASNEHHAQVGTAWAMNFEFGYFDPKDQNKTCRARAVRAFKVYNFLIISGAFAPLIKFILSVIHCRCKKRVYKSTNFLQNVRLSFSVFFGLVLDLQHLILIKIELLF
jgi:hypothetical protein